MGALTIACHMKKVMPGEIENLIESISALIISSVSFSKSILYFCNKSKFRSYKPLQVLQRNLILTNHLLNSW